MTSPTRSLSALILAVILTGCVKTSTVPLAVDMVEIVAEAPAACDAGDAQKAAHVAAAIATVKAGFDRYVVVNTTHQAGRTTAHTPGTGSISSSWQATTSPTAGGLWSRGASSGNFTFFPGAAHQSSMAVFRVKMFKNDDPEAAIALDARQVLGPDWRRIVAKGAPQMC